MPEVGVRPNIPILNWLRILGSPVVVRIIKSTNSKTEARGEHGIFVGFKGRHLYKVALQSNGKIVISRDIRFREELWEPDPGKITHQSYAPGTFRPQGPRRGEVSAATAAMRAALDRGGANTRSMTQKAVEEEDDDDDIVVDSCYDVEDLQAGENDFRTGIAINNWMTSDDDSEPVPDEVCNSLYIIDKDTSTHGEALKGEDEQNWINAIDTEI